MDAHNAGFTYTTTGLADKTVVEIGTENTPNAQNVLVYGVTADGNKYLTKDVDYTIDLGSLDFTQEGTYTITYTYNKDNTIKATLVVEVVVPKYMFQALISAGSGKIYYNAVEQPNGYREDVKEGTQVTLVAVANSG